MFLILIKRQKARPDPDVSAYEVVKEIPAEKAEAIPWFGQQGLGTQFELPKSIDDLVTDGYLKKVSPKFDPGNL